MLIIFYQEHFIWDETDPDMSLQRVRAMWEKQAQRRYKDNNYKSRKAAKKPTWIDDPSWDQWMANWSTPEMIRKRARQQANRLDNPSLHTGGSIGFLLHRERLVCNNLIVYY